MAEGINEWIEAINRRRSWRRSYETKEIYHYHPDVGFEIILYYVLNDVKIRIFSCRTFRGKKHRWGVNMEYIDGNEVVKTDSFEEPYWKDALLKARDFSDERKHRHSLKTISFSPEIRI